MVEMVFVAICYVVTISMNFTVPKIEWGVPQQMLLTPCGNLPQSARSQVEDWLPEAPQKPCPERVRGTSGNQVPTSCFPVKNKYGVTCI
jgi:hypothetical protein